MCNRWCLPQIPNNSADQGCLPLSNLHKDTEVKIRTSSFFAERKNAEAIASRIIVKFRSSLAIPKSKVSNPSMTVEPIGRSHDPQIKVFCAKRVQAQVFEWLFHDERSCDDRRDTWTPHGNRRFPLSYQLLENSGHEIRNAIPRNYAKDFLPFFSFLLTL